jgi:hypothetical protein
MAATATIAGAPGVRPLEAVLGGPISDPAAVTAPPGALGPFYKGNAKLNDGRTAEVVFSPFANLGRWYRYPDARPDINRKLYPYSVWLPA